MPSLQDIPSRRRQSRESGGSTAIRTIATPNIDQLKVVLAAPVVPLNSLNKR